MTGLGTGRGGRPPGLAKTGGRTKGTPNRSTTVLRDKLAELGCEPIEELVKIARDSATERVLKVHIHSLFLRFTHPVPKAAGNSDEDATLDESVMTVNDALTWARYLIERFGQDATQRGDQTAGREGETNQTNNGLTP